MRLKCRKRILAVRQDDHALHIEAKHYLKIPKIPLLRMMVIPEIMCEIVNTLRWIEGLKAWKLYGKQILNP